jgi:outer membrane protein OmpA-like peptidoglycan-associated protein
MRPMTSRDRILARRARFVAAAVALAGCRETEQPAPPRVATAPAPVIPDAGAETPLPDNDGDGVPDERDKCPHVPAPDGGREGCPAPCLMIIAPTKIEIRERIYFAKDSAKLLPESAAVLDAIAAALRDNVGLGVEVQGHADLGEPKTIGAARANAVRDALIKRGVEGQRLTVKDYGQSAPSTTGFSAKNRRVEFETEP